MSRFRLRARQIFTVSAAIVVTVWALFLLLNDPGSPSPQTDAPAVTPVRGRPDDVGAVPSLAGAQPESPERTEPPPHVKLEGSPELADTIDGVVLDIDDGQPIANARVFQRGPNPIIPFSAASATDQNGRFHLRPEPGATGSIVCRALGYLQAVNPASVGPDGLLTISLARGASIRGRVVDDLDAPVEGARVWAFADGNAAAWPHGEEWWLTTDEGQGGTATTDTNGAFEIAGLDPALRFHLRAARPMYSSISDSDETASPGDDVREVVLRLVPVGELSLAVLDEDTGNPVRHAVIAIGTPGGTAMRRPTHYAVLTGETSRQVKDAAVFRFVRVDPSKGADDPVARVKVSAHGYRPQTIEIPARLGARTTYKLKLARERGIILGRVRVRAEWDGGKPFSGQLALMFWNPAYKGGQGVAVTIEDGWSVEEFSLPTGTYGTTTAVSGPAGVWWKGPRILGSCAVAQALSEEPSSCRVTLKGAILRLRVEASDGAPLRGYGLAIVSSDGHGGLRRHWHQEYEASRVGSTRPAHAEVMIPPGRFICYARMPDGRQAHTEVVAGERGEVIEAVVTIR